jgi:hypothetical protein
MTKLAKTNAAPAHDASHREFATLPYGVTARIAYNTLATLLGLPRKTVYTTEDMAGIRAKVNGTPTPRMLEALRHPRLAGMARRLNRQAEVEIRHQTGKRLDLSRQRFPILPLLGDSAFYAVTADGYFLFGNRGNARGQVCRVVPPGIGFASSIKGKWGERPHRDALREAKEEMGLAPKGITDLGVSSENYLAVWPIATRKKGMVLPGVVGGWSYAGFHRYDKTLAELLPTMKLNDENFGVIAIKDDDLMGLPNGKVRALYFSSTAPAAHAILTSTLQASAQPTPLSLTDFRERAMPANGAPKITGQTGHRLVDTPVPMTVESKDFDGLGTHYGAQALLIAEKLGKTLSPEAKKLVRERAQFSPSTLPRIPKRRSRNDYAIA